MKLIAFAKFPPPHTGMTIVTEMFSHMAEEKVEVERINTSYGGMRLSQTGLRRFRMDFLFSVQFARRIWALWNRVRSTKVHSLYLVGSPSPLGLMRNILTVAIVRPYVHQIVVHVHNGNYQRIFQQSLTSTGAQYLADKVDRFIFLSNILSKRLSGFIHQSKRYVVRNTIDKDVRCTEAEVAQKIRRRTHRDELRLLFLSNMLPSKGYMDVARAVSILRAHDDTFSFRVDFIGDWSDKHRRREFRTFLSQEGVSDIAKVHGRVSDRSEIKAALLAADVFLLPTYYPNEAQPLTIIEAMNAATPVVSTNHASIPEYVISDENGYLVAKQSPSEIADAIYDLSEISNWKNKAQCARQTYEDMHSPGSIKKQFYDALNI